MILEGQLWILFLNTWLYATIFFFVRNLLLLHWPIWPIWLFNLGTYPVFLFSVYLLAFFSTFYTYSTNSKFCVQRNIINIVLPWKSRNKRGKNNFLFWFEWGGAKAQWKKNVPICNGTWNKMEVKLLIEQHIPQSWERKWQWWHKKERRIPKFAYFFVWLWKPKKS